MRRLPRVRRPSWKQDTPQMQFVMILQSAEGWVSNLEKGVSTPERALPYIKRALEELKELNGFMPESWEAPNASESETERGSDTGTELTGNSRLGEG